MVKFDHTVPPGKTGRITLSVTLSQPGKFTKKAVVRTNDLKSPSATLTLKGEILPSAANPGGPEKPAERPPAPRQP